MADAPETWVGGWLTQVMLLAFGAAALWMGRPEQATIFIVGASIVGVIRQIERERRAGKARP